MSNLPHLPTFLCRKLAMTGRQPVSLNCTARVDERLNGLLPTMTELRNYMVKGGLSVTTNMFSLTAFLAHDNRMVKEFSRQRSEDSF